ncbi:hypothetical protein QFC22_000862 [Naganishia vaughanmartiniae]|uniref:Uncharacterized protein n=1 Tax=Naganishia vaughanmartiniae TaxID=1424756 RepID=A0ACC2XKB2_9TREE|nr:hypothetical protein QFC22_000862 [Naganishia vaughanmartiniae]
MSAQQALQWPPQAHQDLLDDLPPSHWFILNHARLVREPTRAELCSPYIPLDILDNQEEAKRQRLAEAMRYLEKEAERDDGDARAHAYPGPATHHAVLQSKANEHADHVPGPSHIAATAVAVNHMQTHREQGKCSSRAMDKGYNRTHTHAASPTAVARPVSHSSGSAILFADVSTGNAQSWQPQRRRRIRVAVNQERRVLSVPKTAKERAHLVVLFREEILHNHVNRFVDLEQPARVYGRTVRMAEVKQAIRNDGLLGNKPYLLMANITRHDWNRTSGICTYTVNLKNGPKNGSAEYLAEYYAGVDHTLWEYWGCRKSIRPHHVRRYISACEPQGFYQAIMYQHLPTREWIRRWQQLRDSGRV